MSNGLFAAVEVGLFCAAVFGLAIWQLVKVRRSIRRDRQDAENARAIEP